MNKKNIFLLMAIIFILLKPAIAQPPNWAAIKSNATFIVPDTTYNTPYIQPLYVNGWEDGLFITRDGLHLYSTYLPLDALSWLFDLLLDPACFNFNPYYRPPLLGIDTTTNIWGCLNFMQSDIIISSRTDTSQQFNLWNSSNLQTSFSFDGGAHGILLNPDTFDVFVFTKDGIGTQSTDIMFMRNVPTNPNTNSAVAILSTPAQEDNPHIERLNDTTLLLFFDRERYMYYSISINNGNSWQTPVEISNVLNDQAPYDAQPHLWNDGANWWVYFCADNLNGKRCIYKSKQLISNNWNSWDAKELVIEPDMIVGGSGNVLAVGEPTLTQWGDLSFVVVYGNSNSTDTTDVFDADPWIMTKKSSPLITVNSNVNNTNSIINIYPNPSSGIFIFKDNKSVKTVEVFNLLGELILSETNAKQINLQGFPKGVYVARINGVFVNKLVRD